MDHLPAGWSEGWLNRCQRCVDGDKDRETADEEARIPGGEGAGATGSGKSRKQQSPDEHMMGDDDGECVVVAVKTGNDMFAQEGHTNDKVPVAAAPDIVNLCSSSDED